MTSLEIFPLEEREKTKRRCESVSVEWTIEPHGDVYALYAGRGSQYHGARLCNLDDFDANGPAVRDYIAHARTDLPKALQALEVVERELAQRESYIDALVESRQEVLNRLDKAEADLSWSRPAARWRKMRKSVASEKVAAHETGEASDFVYNRAIDDALAAIDRIANEDVETTALEKGAEQHGTVSSSNEPNKAMER